MRAKDLKKFKLPDKPGVYFFIQGTEILYIGKATSLKSRVRSYFNPDLITTRGPAIADMVFKANKIKYQITDTVLEALILEASLIKKHQPKYNTKEKSDKSFNYVCITGEELPRVVVVRGRELSKLQNFAERRFSRVLGSPRAKRSARPARKPSFGSVFGPFTNGSQLREGLKIVRKIFPYLDDKSKNYMEFYKQINLVPDLKDKKLYKQNIRNIKLFFSGKKKQILKNLKKEMKEYAKVKEFEKAGELKRQIFALEHINDVALLKDSDYVGDSFSSGPRVAYGSTRPFTKATPDSVYKIEAYDIAHMSGKNMVGVMTVVEDGEALKSEYRKFIIKTQKNANDTGALAEVLDRRLGHPEWPYPKLIVVDGGKAQINVALKVLSKAGIAIPVVSVVKDEHHRPKNVLGRNDIISKYEREILLANSEAHRFAIAYHKKTRARNFLK